MSPTRKHYLPAVIGTIPVPAFRFKSAENNPFCRHFAPPPLSPVHSPLPFCSLLQNSDLPFYPPPTPELPLQPPFQSKILATRKDNNLPSRQKVQLNRRRFEARNRTRRSLNSKLSMAMSVASKLQSPICEPRAVLGPGGNRVRVLEGPKRKDDGTKKPPQQTPRPRKPVPELPESVVRSDVSVDSTCSSDTWSSGYSAKTASPARTVRHKCLRPAKVASDDAEVTKPAGPPKRCEWITPHADPIYTCFHDEEWGVPVYDDTKLFELLVLSQALAELSWPEILHKRDTFRKRFDNFDPSSIAKFEEKKLLSLKVNGIPLLSEQKLRAIMENAKQMLKVQQAFGSFSNYCWSFVNHKPVRNGFRYARQVPVKSPKAEVISKDLMKRGFRCVGPTVVYSFMQVAGIVNDHLATCFRYKECDANAKTDPKHKIETKTGEEGTKLSEAMEIGDRKRPN